MRDQQIANLLVWSQNGFDVVIINFLLMNIHTYHEESGLDPRMIVVERAGETAGFLVDRVSRVVKLDPSELESHPVVSAAEQSDYVGGVFQAPDGLVILLDLEKILASQS